MREFQDAVDSWTVECFGREVAFDKSIRNFRFIEEALELVQACGMTADECHQLVEYVYGRPVGERAQEIGGVMVTLAALCTAQGESLAAQAWREIERVNLPEMIEKIRAKQAGKPRNSPLPQPYVKTDER